MAGKGARTHARILDTHTMCKQTNVWKTVTENDEGMFSHRFSGDENDQKMHEDDDDFKNNNNKTASQNAAIE